MYMLCVTRKIDSHFKKQVLALLSKKDTKKILLYLGPVGKCISKNVRFKEDKNFYGRKEGRNTFLYYFINLINAADEHSKPIYAYPI